MDREARSQQGGMSGSSADGLPVLGKAGVQEECPPLSVDRDPIVSPLPPTTTVMLLTACLTLSNIVSSFANTGVAVMLDELAEDLDVAENNLQWIINSFQLPMVSEHLRGICRVLASCR
jgi:hypothetical protein